MVRFCIHNHPGVSHVQKKSSGPRPLASSLAINNLDATSEANRERAIMVRNRLKLSGMHNLGTGTNLNTASLLHHEHGGGAPGEEKAMICWQVSQPPSDCH